MIYQGMAKQFVDFYYNNLMYDKMSLLKLYKDSSSMT
jgi:hypothetical protein